MLKYLFKKLLLLVISLFLFSLVLFSLLCVTQNRLGLAPEANSLPIRYFRWISGAGQSIVKGITIRKYVTKQFSAIINILGIGLFAGVAAGVLSSYALCLRSQLAWSAPFRIFLHVLRSLPFPFVLMLFHVTRLGTSNFLANHRQELLLGILLAAYLIYRACLKLTQLKDYGFNSKEKMKLLILEWLRLNPQWLPLYFFLSVYVGGYGGALTNFIPQGPPQFFLLLQYQAVSFCLLSFLLDALMQYLLHRWSFQTTNCSGYSISECSR